MCESNPVVVPSCLKWTEVEVADWIEEIGFSIYKVRTTAIKRNWRILDNLC